MEKNTQGLIAVFAILSLLVGFSLGAVLIGEDVETIKEVPVEVEKIVEVPVEIVVEAPSQLELAVAEFMLAVENEEDEAENNVNILDNMHYNFDEVSVYDIEEDYSIEVTSDGDVTKVEFEVRLKFKDSRDTERQSYAVEVTYEDNEDTLVDFTKL